MANTVFTLPGSVIRKKLQNILEMNDETDKLLTFHNLLKEFGNEAILQNQILYLEKKFKRLSVLYDSLVLRKRHLLFLMEAYDFSSKESQIPGQLKLFELLPEVLEKDLEQLSHLQREIEKTEGEKNQVLAELMEI